MSRIKSCRYYRLFVQHPDVKVIVHKSSLLLTNGSVRSRLSDERIICNTLVIPFYTSLAPSLSRIIISRHTILHHTCGALDTYRTS
jgi:hypothetical protein